MLKEGCEGDEEKCGAEFVSKSQDIPKQTQLTNEVMNEMCGHWTNADRKMIPDRSPDFEVADEGDRSKVALALANGMFGEYDGIDKNCGAWCLYDVDVATSNLAWIWDKHTNRWRRNNKPWLCWSWRTRNE